MKKNRIAEDFILNLLASLTTTCVTQLCIYPLLARMLAADEYGLLLTIMGVGNSIVGGLGNSLNNVRLMRDAEYKESGIIGDFNLLNYFLACFSIVISFTYMILFQDANCVTIVLFVMYALVGTMRSYGVVAFRLQLNYRDNLECNVVAAVGSVVGVLLMGIINSPNWWPITFVMGELFGLLFVLSKSKIFYEPIIKSKRWKATLKEEVTLLLTTVAANVLTYLDRLLLLPLLGGEAVSIYTVASFFGKSVGVLMIPMAGVLLSYYSQKNFKMDIKIFWKINCAIFGMISVFGIGCKFFSLKSTKLIYPTLVEAAKPYLMIANVVSLLGIAGNMIQPSILRYAHVKWQLIIQIIYMTCYLFGGIFGAKHFGLMGFSRAAIIAAVVRIVLLLTVGHIALERRGSKDEINETQNDVTE